MPRRPFTLLDRFVKPTLSGRRRIRREPPYPALMRLVDNFDNTTPAPDVLLFGDSVALRVSRDDINTDTLDQMLAKKLRGKASLLCIAHTAYHTEVFGSLLKVLTVTRTNPKLVVLPVNLRSFSPQWDLYPAWQFNDEIRAAESYLANPSLDITSVTEVVVTPDLLERFDAIPVKYALTDKSRIGQFRTAITSKPTSEQQRRSRLRDIFIYHYTYPLTSDHRKLVALGDCVRTLAGLNIPLMVYCTPINWQAGVRYVGKDFVTAVRENRDTIASGLSGYARDTRTRFADFSMLLGSDCFFSDHDPTEHLNERGRWRLTDELANACSEGEPNQLQRCHEG